ncbi:PREDICTED: uncharacterized protein LOC105555918 isoform X2 [Vollenhovia emeryi]|uniref:uncharacterized protein LOC105555918 isoform X2 n=1 Tax=Vollenhovia emeryi TaxID=411798 RepID=UPI0005F45A74|nr:PREDICTED: uncharacterized protein LOC105555918 isoform X2 [Vollenhovia emeryi]
MTHTASDRVRVRPARSLAYVRHPLPMRPCYQRPLSDSNRTPGLITYGDIQSACIISEKQSFSSSSPCEVASVDHSPKRNLSNISISTNISSSSSNLSLSPFAFPSYVNEFVNSEQITAENKELEDTPNLQVNVEDTAVEFATNIKEDFTEATAESEDELKDFNDVTTAPIQTSSEKSVQERQSPISDFNISDSEAKNPLFNLLHKNGSHFQKLIHNIHRNDLVPVGSDINLIGKVTAKHLLNLATPPQRKIPTSTLIRWAEYFKRLFPKTPTSAFYFFKYESYRRPNGTIVQRKRAEGVLQVQLFQERRKLIKENRDALLRQPSTSTGEDRDPCTSNDTSHITNTWRSVSQSEGEVQLNTEVPREVSLIQADPTVQSHLNYLQNPLHHKLSPELVSSWKATFPYRRKQLLDQSGTVWDYLNEYTFLQIEEIGKTLIQQDFEILCPDLDPVTRYSGNLAQNCEKCRLAIITTSSAVIKRASQRKHKNIATPFFDLAKHDSNVTLRVTGTLLLLPFIFPYVYVHKTWRPTRTDIVESFVARVCSETEVEEHIECRRKSWVEIARKLKISTSVQPYVLAVGPTWDNISHSHIIVDKVLYTCKNVVEAVELCFKLFHVFHCDYPPESKHVWQMIQQGFYNLFLEDHDINRRTIIKALADIGIYVEEKNLRTKLTKNL